MASALLRSLMMVGLILLSGCATVPQSVGAGTVTGAGVGAGAGALSSRSAPHSDRIKHVIIGAGTGAVIGMAAGHITHEAVASREAKAYDAGRSDGRERAEPRPTNSEEQPALLPARTEAIFVDDQIRGNVFIPAHFEYRIVEPARWSR